MNTRPSPWILAAALALAPALRAQPRSSAYVDDQGVLRWSASGREVTLFGVNYTAPFAYDFRALHRLGISEEKAIDADVYHFARLGLDAYRVHVWDREISDANGNLVVNDHLRAFDYLLTQLKARGIKIILTAMQFGNAGYPEGGETLSGFSAKYGKAGCLENRASWPLQERYLAQFVSHVNPLTGVAFKEDPDILAFEICNEPGHFEYGRTLEYINCMVAAIRATGCAKPIFYNMSHGLPVVQAYLDANVQGGTFQWYPENLLAGHEQRGNFLPYLDDYPIPFAANPKFRTKAKMVYEFDAADIGRSYLYPAFARTFRRVGVQFATQFAYDPMYLAACNTEYQTHYMNLAYAPQKAIALMVAGEAFRRVPRFQDYGGYPGNTSFAGVHISYAQDLAELVTAERFIYSNNTVTRPPSPENLVQVAGCGTSPVIAYPGRGAYFLDRLEPGVWRLEVMPDAIWVHDPFATASPLKQVSRIAWREWPMRIELPDLGRNFSAVGLNDGDDFRGSADGTTLHVRPGTYLLTRAGVTTHWSRDDRWHNLTLREFVAPGDSIDRTYVLHQPAVEATAGRDLRVAATVVSPREVRKVDLVAYLPRTGTVAEPTPTARAQPGGGNGPGAGPIDLHGARIFPATRVAGDDYAATIPGDLVVPGTLRYHLVVEGKDGVTTFPSRIKRFPTDWDFYGRPWETRFVPAGAPILLFAAGDYRQVTADHRDVRFELVPSDRPGTSAMEVRADDLSAAGHDYSFRFFCRDKIRGRTSDLPAMHAVVLHGRSDTAAPCPLQLALVTVDGIAYGGLVSVPPAHGDYVVPVSALRQVRSPNIPHGYPVFIHFWSERAEKIPLDLSRIEAVLVSIGPGIAPADYATPHGVQIERIWLQ